MLVNLQIQQKVSETESILDNVKAKTWGDFTIITFDGPEDFADSGKQVAEVWGKTHPNNTVVVMRADADVTFYGIEREGDDQLIYGSPSEWVTDSLSELTAVAK